MNNIDWTSARVAKLSYSYSHFANAKLFVFEKWCELAVDRCIAKPLDLSGSCKYGSLFVQSVFGGSIRGHFEHQYNIVEGRIVDLSHDALDVGLMFNPYSHEQEFFSVSELQSSLVSCTPRVEKWATEFIKENS
jgi:hypothetical protein